MSTDDVAALHRLFDTMNDAWARADAEAFGSVFTEDADYVIYTGTHYRGRAKIIDTHDALWSRFLRGTRLHGEIDRIRFPGPDVAVVISRGTVVKKHTRRPKADKVQTLVAVRGDDGWRFTAFQNTRRKPLLEWISSRSEPRMAP
jgi:uncharacterized protein (TIGR02246 family)